MATRDLTAAFMKCRKRRSVFNISSDSKSDSGLLDDAATTSSDWRVSIPPKWISAVEQVEDDLREIDRKMEELTAMHRTRLMVRFDDSECANDQAIDAIAHAITGLLRRCEAIVREQMSSLDGASETDSDTRVRTNIQSSLAKKLQERSMKFRGLQREYMSKLGTMKSGAMHGGVSELDFLTVDQDRSSARASGSQRGGGLTSQQLAVVDDMDDLVNARDEEITRIADSIEELSQIFKELAVLVIDQGTILDRIDFNMEQVVEHTKEGLAQLGKAEANQKSARPLKCIAILLILIGILLTLLVLKHTR